MTEAVSRLKTRLDRLDASRLVFYGHSLGAVIAFELARSVAPSAAALVVSGRRSPDTCSDLAQEDLTDSRNVRTLMIRLMNPPTEVLADSALLTLASRAFVADLEISRTYLVTKDITLNIPVTVAAFDRDDVVPPEAMNGWEKFTTASFDQVALEGGHDAPAGAPAPLLKLLGEHF